MSPLSQYIKEPFASLSHAAGAVLSVVATVVLLVRIDGPIELAVAVAVYGLTLTAVYTASALTHGLHCSPRLSIRLDKLDYASIYLAIAGTYTPLCIGPLAGRVGYSLLVAVWAMAVAGVLSTVWMTGRGSTLRTSLYVAMGWAAVLAAGPLLDRLSAVAFAWLIAGGVIYSVGAIVYATRRPTLWPGRFVAHDLWHMMVLAGSACHFAAITHSTLV